MSDIKFSTDDPVVDPLEQDRLGFSNFSKRLSDIIRNSFTSSGFVIGLSGSWGSGKTSAINFTKRYIRDSSSSHPNGDSRIQIIDFEPWLFSGKVDLIAAFFQVLAEHFPEENASKIRKKIGSAIGRNTDTLASLFAAVGATVDPTAGLLSSAVTKIGKNSLDDLVSSWLQQPSLQRSYAKLTERLMRERRKILVVIDDIDRLQPAEIRAMMQMVKSVGKLPYVTYLLSYDSKHVAAAIHNGFTAPGEPSYLEKIVQQELMLPRPDRSRLLAMLDTEINFITDHAQDGHRWYEVVTNGVHQWIKRPRDVNRLANALKFSWPILQGEIDPIDLIAMEGIRLFDPFIFDWISKNQDFLFPNGHHIFDEREQKLRAELLQNHVDKHSTRRVLRLLANLFPSKGELFTGDRHILAEPYYQVVRRLGIGSQTVFQSYMQLFVSDASVTGEDIRLILGNLNNQGELTRALKSIVEKKSASGRSVISDALELLRYHLMAPSPEKPTQCFLNSLFSIGPDVTRLKDEGGILSFGASTSLYFLILDVLERLQSDSKVNALIQAVEASESTSYGVQNFCDIAILLGKLGDYEGRTQSPISEDDLNTYCSALQIRFDEDLKSDAYLSYPAIWTAIRFYEYLYGKEKCRAWVTSSATKDPRFIIGICDALITTTTDVSGTRYSIKRKPDSDVYDLPVLLPLAEQTLSTMNLEETTREKLKSVVRDLKALLASPNANSEDNLEISYK